MNLYIMAGLVVMVLGAIAWAAWAARKRAKAEDAASDARLRAEAGRASEEAYVKKREELAKTDPVSGRPIRRL